MSAMAPVCPGRFQPGPVMNDLVKLALVAACVCVASLATRRFGHAVGGTLGGLPMIAGPITGFVMLANPVPTVQGIVLATLVCLPATMAHLLTFAWCALRWPWWLALLAANMAFFALGLSLSLWPWSAWQATLLVVLSLVLANAAMPRRRVAAAAVRIPGVELLCRVLVAMGVAWLIIRSAGVAPAAISGLLLAVPITGNVLPCFTRQGHGAAATVTLLRGFMRGLSGFVAFFLTLLWALDPMSPGAAYATAWAVALAVASALYVWHRRR